MTAPWMPPLPDGGPARFRCESCEGSGRDGHMMYQGEFQPPEDGPCPDCDGRGWHLEKNAVDADQMRRAQADAARAALEAAATKCESIYRKWNAGSENADRYRVQDETVDACAHFIRALAKEVT